MSRLSKFACAIIAVVVTLGTIRVLAILFFGTATYESLAGSQLAASAIHKIDPVLMSHGLCPTYKNECPQKDTIGAHGIKSGEHFEIWGIADQSFLLEITQIITAEWLATDLQTLEIVAHPYPWIEEQNHTVFLWFGSDYFTVHLRRNKQ